MEFRGALRFLRLLLFAEMTCDITKWRVRCQRLRVDRLVGFLCRGRSRLIFPRLDLCAIFWCQDLTTLQVFVGVNVLCFFVSAFFSGAFLACRFGDILTIAFGRAETGAEEKQDRGETETQPAGGMPHGSGVLDRWLDAGHRLVHGKPTAGDAACRRAYLNRVLLETVFFTAPPGDGHCTTGSSLTSVDAYFRIEVCL